MRAYFIYACTINKLNIRESDGHNATEMHSVQKPRTLLLKTILGAISLQKMLCRIYRKESKAYNHETQNVFP